MKELKLPPSVKYNGNGLKMLSRAMGKKTIWYWSGPGFNS
jgi:hypothetical protein